MKAFNDRSIIYRVYDDSLFKEPEDFNNYKHDPIFLYDFINWTHEGLLKGIKEAAGLSREIYEEYWNQNDHDNCEIFVKSFTQCYENLTRFIDTEIFDRSKQFYSGSSAMIEDSSIYEQMRVVQSLSSRYRAYQKYVAIVLRYAFFINNKRYYEFFYSEDSLDFNTKIPISKKPNGGSKKFKLNIDDLVYEWHNCHRELQELEKLWLNFNEQNVM